MSDYTSDDLDFLILHHLEQAIAAGHPPRGVAAWRSDCRQDMLANERAHPGYITSAANGIRAKATGRRLTGWRETRGTHGIDYLPDPKGTDRPPWV